MKDCRGRNDGFTLVELMTVIAIMALLSALVLGLAGNAQKTAARKRASSEVEQLSSFVTDYLAEYGRVPSSPEALWFFGCSLMAQLCPTLLQPHRL